MATPFPTLSKFSSEEGAPSYPENAVGFRPSWTNVRLKSSSRHPRIPFAAIQFTTLMNGVEKASLLAM